jgi:amino acid adenylation domain-containing protein
VDQTLPEVVDHPLSDVEARIWLAEQVRPGEPVRHNATVHLLGRSGSTALLAAALDVLLRRHPRLRARFPVDGRGPRRRTDVAPDAIRMEEPNLPAGGSDSDPDRARAAVLASVAQPFDLAAGPLLRPALVRATPDHALLVLVIHSIVADERSTRVLGSELVELYEAGRNGCGLPSSVSPPEPLPADRPVTGDLVAVAAALDGVPRTEPAADRPRPAEPTWAGRVHRRRWDTGPPVPAGASGSSVLVAGVVAVLWRETPHDEIVVGIDPPSDGTRRSIGCPADPRVVRVRVGAHPTFAGLLDATRHALDAPAVPLDRLAVALRQHRDPGRHPVFDVAVSTDPGPQDRHGTLLPFDTGTARCDLEIGLHDRPSGERFLVIRYSTELFDEERIAALGARLTRLLELALADPDLRLGDLCLLDDATRLRMVRDWNDTAQDHRDIAALCVHEAFERWVEATPTAPAVRFEGEELDYLGLDRRANQLARHLRQLGAGPEVVVGILLERGLELPVALLGILKAGAAYLPLDPGHPAGRLRQVTADAGCGVVVTTCVSAAALPEDVLPVCLDDPAVAATLAAMPDDAPRHPVRPGNLAYLLYTSGSTGPPKGTLIQHDSVVNMVEYCRRAYSLAAPDRILQFANPSFDVSVFDFFAALCNGLTLVQAARLTLFDPHALTDLIRDERVTVMDIPPAVAGLLDPTGLPDLRMANIGGETLPCELADRFQAPHRQVHNTYGPTEVTVTSTDFRCPPGLGEGSVPIGRPIDNLTAYVLDRHGNLSPVGVPGELVMGGIGVGRGYHDRPALTAERFVPDPFGPPGSRVYRTGDVVRQRADGNLVFVDRVDTQLKVHGHRVEPGEIEVALCEHPDIDGAVVDLVGPSGDRTLAAFVVAQEGRAAPSTRQVREHLRGRLPSHMIPGRTIPLPGVPLTANGKVDRSQLQRIADAGRGGGAPGDRASRELVALWAEVLDLDATGEPAPRDDFFALGGGAARAEVLRQRLRDRFGVGLEWRAFVADPTLGHLAHLVGSGGPERQPMTSRSSRSAR